jgi:tetratricopeptide (TPR) repeat protein
MTRPAIQFRFIAVSFVLFFGTLLLFSRTLSHGFLDLDDPDYVTQNNHVLNGLTPAGIHWAFTTGTAANWHPITWLSLMLDAQLYGNYPGGFHFTNNLLHALNAVLAFLALLKLTSLRTQDASPPPDAFWACAACAAIFAWHPLRVESVAWIAERKDVLSAFFFFTTLLAYAAFVGRPEIRTAKSWAFYILALFLFALGLISKPMLVTLPFLLLVLDWWPLWRLNRFTLPRLLAEKIPFFALAFASCVITLLVQKNGDAIIESETVYQRWSNAAVSVLRYLQHVAWPRHLAIVYPLPPHWPLQIFVSAIAALIFFTALALWQSSRRPWLLVGWLWFVGLLLPVLGFVQVGLQAMADRYTYLPMLGLLLAVIWTLRELKWPVSLKSVLVALALLACGAQTWLQIGFWQTSQTLYEHALTVIPDNYPAECYLGTLLSKSGHFSLAEYHLRRAIAAKPDFKDARFKLGVTLANMGRTDDALAAYRELLSINPHHALANYSLGLLLLHQGNPAAAIPYFQTALQNKPNFNSALAAIGIAQARLGQTDLALASFEKALALKPDDFTTHYSFANTLNDLHHGPEALAQYELALQLAPNFPQACCHYADALEALGRPAEARAQYRQALELYPQYAAAYFGLAVVFEDLGQSAQAIACYQRAVILDPANAGAQYNLGTMLLNQDHPADALAHFTAAQRLAPDNASAFLGAGLAREQLGHQAEAIAEYETALHLNPNLPGLQQQLARARQSLAAQAKP